ncbi:MAG: glycosyltransferase [Anaerolineales bacterium]|nr:glycosyltransferase [Anaerolineales bacterium]
MRLLFIADGRSPTAIGWIRNLVELGHEVHLISSFLCNPGLPLDSLTYIPVAFSGAATTSVSRLTSSKAIGPRGIRFRTAVRHWLGPWTLRASAKRVREKIEEIQPDLVHALRIPFEGMLATTADPVIPLVISIWGNDFTLHAPASKSMGKLTRQTMERADALHTDCFRDQRLAHTWGFHEGRPAIVLPGGGGVRYEYFHPSVDKRDMNATPSQLLEEIPDGIFVVVNPRGLRTYVRNDTFFQSIPLILAKESRIIFLCPTMAGEWEAEQWLDRLNIRGYVRLLPRLTQREMGKIFRRGQITVSPSEHDGTPNTLLEAMTCGSYPIAGDLESIREWIKDGSNGLLIDPSEPESLASAVVKALSSPEQRRQAATDNFRMIAERAAQPRVKVEAEAFYLQILS